MNKKLKEAQQKIVEDIIGSKLPEEIKKSHIEYISFRRELTLESDRGCALLAAAHLDFMFEKLLQKKLLGNKKHLEVLFGINGSIWRQSSRFSEATGVNQF